MKEKQNRRGRPEIKPAQRRSALVGVRMTEQEYRQLKKAAKKEKVSVGTYLLNLWRKRGK